MSPTVLQTGPYRFFFFASDQHQPHVHVKRDAKLAENESALLKARHDYFGIRQGHNGGGKGGPRH